MVDQGAYLPVGKTRQSADAYHRSIESDRSYAPRPQPFLAYQRLSALFLADLAFEYFGQFQSLLKPRLPKHLLHLHLPFPAAWRLVYPREVLWFALVAR